MRCPFCQNLETKVTDSREADDGRVIRRRRECLKCASRFSTYEQVEILDLTVIKKDGTRENYDKNKMFLSIKIAARKRLSDDEVQKFSICIEAQIRALGKPEITSSEIGEMILEKLKEKDQVSYLRFASVFKSFGSGKQFLKELNKLEEIT